MSRRWSTRSPIVPPIGVALLLLALPIGLVAEQAPRPPTPKPKDVEPPPPAREEDQVRLPQDDLFRFVEDGPMINRGKVHQDVRRETAGVKEAEAYDLVLTHARKQPDELLRKYSMKNVPFQNLIRPVRQDYMRELIHIEGRLALILPQKLTPGLEGVEGFKELYEAWIFPAEGTDPVVLVVPELPAGIKPGKGHYQQVAFDAYYFKLFHYESTQEKEPGKNQWRMAPLFLGKSFEVVATDEASSSYGGGMLAMVVIGLVVLVGVIVVMSFWLRRGDRRIEAASRNRILDNVAFDETPAA